MERVVLFTDPGFEEATQREIAEAKTAMEAVLAAWDSLKLTAINSTSELYDLIQQPEMMFKEALMSMTRRSSDTNVPVPAPRPINPEPFYASVRSAKSFPYTGRQYGLFTIEKKKVVVNEEQAELYINARTLYADSEEQVQFYEDAEAFVRFFNTCNQKMNGTLTSTLQFRGTWSQLLNLAPEGYDSYPAQLRTDVLRELMQMI